MYVQKRKRKSLDPDVGKILIEHMINVIEYDIIFIIIA